MSSAAALVKGIDPLLLARGFKRKRSTWNRRKAGMVDIVDVQVAKSGGSAFVNLGVADASVYRSVWERPLPDFVRGPASTVTTRLGRLFADSDVSWDLADARSIGEIVQRLESHGLPFLERMHDVAEMAAHLRGLLPGLVPVERLGAAVVLSRAGDRDGACAILQRLADHDPTDTRIRRLIDEVGCAA